MFKKIEQLLGRAPEATSKLETVESRLQFWRGLALALDVHHRSDALQIGVDLYAGTTQTELPARFFEQLQEGLAYLIAADEYTHGIASKRIAYAVHNDKVYADVLAKLDTLFTSLQKQATQERLTQVSPDAYSAPIVEFVQHWVKLAGWSKAGVKQLEGLPPVELHQRLLALKVQIIAVLTQMQDFNPHGHGLQFQSTRLVKGRSQTDRVRTTVKDLLKEKQPQPAFGDHYHHAESPLTILPLSSDNPLGIIKGYFQNLVEDITEVLEFVNTAQFDQPKDQLVWVSHQEDLLLAVQRVLADASFQQNKAQLKMKRVENRTTQLDAKLAVPDDDDLERQRRPTRPQRKLSRREDK